MDYSATFARHFARLVSLLMHDAGSVVEQKASLRALVALSRSGPVTIVGNDTLLEANDRPVPGALTGVHDVAGQMRAHSIVGMHISAGASAADLLGLARIIAATAAPGDGGSQARGKLRALGAAGIEFTTLEPVTDASEAHAIGPADEAPTLVVPAAASAALGGVAEGAKSDLASSANAILAQLTGPDMSKATPDQLLEALEGASTADSATRALDDLALLAEHSMRVGRTAAVADILYGIVAREPATEGDVKRAFVLAIRRLSKPALLRGVAMLVPRKPEMRQYCYEVLERTGEEGADALIEQITQAPTTDDRRSLFEVLCELRDAVPALRRMLGDSRWFVVRNAADILGEMAATAAESDLVALLRHGDDRVRRSATNALLRLGTPDALKGIYEAVNDSSPEVRMQAAAAIATRRDGRTSTTLIRAIEDEQDADVQLAMIAALGKVATPEAVQKLSRMAEPEARLFRRKTIGLRVAAVQALGEARTPAALNSLRELAGDKDREVRDTAARALAQVGR